jgi:hypothetical protein
VTYWGGRWRQLRGQIPQFKIEDFQVSKEYPANPYMKSVVRLPRASCDQVIPVGVVSNTYTLVQHDHVVEKCFEAIRRVKIDPDPLRCELGLTELGEWMTLRVFFPDRFSYTPKDGQRLDLCLECFNSVEGSSRLIVLFSWLRFICTNGLVIRETQAELSDLHNRNIDLEKITDIVVDGLNVVEQDTNRLSAWESHQVPMDRIESWANKILATAWGVKAACRVFHICRNGHDVDFADPFAPGEPSKKPVVEKEKVPGASAPAGNLYDVSQALAWVASNFPSTDERLERQASISNMITKLEVIG